MVWLFDDAVSTAVVGQSLLSALQLFPRTALSRKEKCFRQVMENYTACFHSYSELSGPYFERYSIPNFHKYGCGTYYLKFHNLSIDLFKVL